jgi:hypothetical protein
MRRHSESTFESLALGLVLSLTVIYGCRAFDPEPVTVNKAPNTSILGAPAETTGTRFLRHLYWYGNDSDGEVVRFIYAVTDSTVQDYRTPDIDEEDTRFNPATDVTTLEPMSWRTVGYTTKTDSIFLFTVDRGSTPSKDMTFHIVAVDDLGAIDPTPARLRFVNNSLGNPVVKFSVSTRELDGAGQPFWLKRWVGTAAGPSASESPELSAEPFIGFARAFRIEWEASSPNGPINGYRYKANQNGTAPFVPPLGPGGIKRWDLNLTSFDFANDRDPQTLPDCDINPTTGELSEESNCPPETVRWPSDRYAFSVEAQDVALVETEAAFATLRFNVNYPPETDIVLGAPWPLYRARNASGGTDVVHFASGDTIPWGAYAVIAANGYDQTPERVAPATYGPFCCDTPLVTSAVRFQARYRGRRDENGRFTEAVSLFSFPYGNSSDGEPDTIGVNVGPMAYDFAVRSTDEHLRPDGTPDTLRFVGGFEPRLLSTRPAEGNALIIRQAGQGTWPGSLAYTASTSAENRWWNGIEFLQSDPCTGLSGTALTACQAQNPVFSGQIYTFQMRFEGRAHPLEPQAHIRAWSYSQLTVNDPLNVLQDGPESEDLSFYYVPGTLDVWDFTDAEAIKLFIPVFFWSLTDLFEPASPAVSYRQVGKWLVRRLGEATLRVQGRTTVPGDTWRIYQHVRPDESDAVQLAPIEKAGRRTPEHVVHWSIYLGIGNFGDTTPSRLWPDFDTSLYAD